MAAGLSMPQNSLTLVIDEGGVYYRVPISCINEPLNYGANVPDLKLKSKIVPVEKLYKVRNHAYLINKFIDVKGTVCKG